MSEQTAAIKAKLEAQATALGSISTNVAGIQTDITSLKQQIADLSNGATAEEIAELSTLVDGISSNIDVIGTTTASLDAETP